MRVGRALHVYGPLLAFVVLSSLVVLPVSAAHAAGLSSASAQVPARDPEPQPQPQPGPVVPPPDSGRETAEPEPAPGPTPAPGRPEPPPDRPSSPEPTPGPTPPATPPDPNADGFFGNLFDLPGMVVNAITAFLGTLVEQAMKPLRELLADTLLATPDVTEHADIKRLWDGSMAITVGIYVLFVTGGGLTVMGYETVQTRYALKQIAPRLLVGIIAAATSLTVMGKAISLANTVAHAIMGSDLSDAGQGLVERALPFSLFGPKGIAVYLLLLAVVELVLVIAVLVGFIVRVALMVLLAVAAPLALSCHAHPLTDPLARLWWRGLAGCLVIQVAQSMTFVLALKLFFAPGATALGIPKADQLGTLLAGLALFWVLFKIPGWTVQVVLRGSPIQQPHTPAPVRMLRQLAMYQVLGQFLPGLNRHQGRGIRPGGGAGGRGRGGGGSPGAGRRGGRPGGGPGGPGVGPGGAGGGPRRPGGGAGGRGRAAGPGRARAGRPAPPRPATPGAGAGPAGGAPPGPPAPAPSPAPAPAPGPAPAPPPRPAPPPPRPGAPARRGPQPPPRNAPPAPRPAQGPRAIPHPAQARHIRQLALPVPAHRAPAQPPRPVQGWLPIAAPRIPRPNPAFPTQAAAPPAAPPARTPVPRTRQLALPVPAARVRVRPARPIQLRLPLEPPRPPRTTRRRMP